MSVRKHPTWRRKLFACVVIWTGSAFWAVGGLTYVVRWSEIAEEVMRVVNLQPIDLFRHPRPVERTLIAVLCLVCGVFVVRVGVRELEACESEDPLPDDSMNVG